MGFAARIGQKLGQVANNFAAGRKEAIAGVLEAKKLSASLAASPVRDVVSAGSTPHAPDSLTSASVRTHTSLQAPKAAPGRSLGVSASGAQRSSLRVAQKAIKAEDEKAQN